MPNPPIEQVRDRIAELLGYERRTLATMFINGDAVNGTFWSLKNWNDLQAREYGRYHPVPETLDGIAAVTRELEDMTKRGDDLEHNWKRAMTVTVDVIATDRDRWQREALAARPFVDLERCKLWANPEVPPVLPQHDEYVQARAANEAARGMKEGTKS